MAAWPASLEVIKALIIRSYRRGTPFSGSREFRTFMMTIYFLLVLVLTFFVVLTSGVLKGLVVVGLLGLLGTVPTGLLCSS